MTRQQAKDRADAVRFWGNGGNLWSYCLGKWVMFTLHELDFIDENSASYIMEDRYFEARKAHALGEPIEYRVPDGKWFLECSPIWNDGYNYRPKPIGWYNNIPAKGVLCWVWNNEMLGKTVANVMVYDDKTRKFMSNWECQWWLFAEPIKPEECLAQEGLRDDK